MSPRCSHPLFRVVPPPGLLSSVCTCDDALPTLSARSGPTGAPKEHDTGDAERQTGKWRGVGEKRQRGREENKREASKASLNLEQCSSRYPRSAALHERWAGLTPSRPSRLRCLNRRWKTRPCGASETRWLRGALRLPRSCTRCEWLWSRRRRWVPMYV